MICLNPNGEKLPFSIHEIRDVQAGGPPHVQLTIRTDREIFTLGAAVRRMACANNG